MRILIDECLPKVLALLPNLKPGQVVRVTA